MAKSIQMDSLRLDVCYYPKHWAGRVVVGGGQE